MTQHDDDPPQAGPPPLPTDPAGAVPPPPSGEPPPLAGPPGSIPPPGSVPPPPGSVPPPPEGYLPMDAKPGRRGGITRKVVIGVIAVLLLGGVGALISVLREATASPKDKEACLATVEMIETDGRTIDNAMTRWSAADDGTIREQIANVQTAMASRDAAKLADAVNRVIARCNKISSEFRSRFDKYCDTHEGACRRNFGL